MRVLIIKEEDIQTLRDKLKLEKFNQQRHQQPVDEIYRHFNFVVETWLREQGV